MSLNAILAQPMSERRFPPHRPRAADASKRKDHLKALDYRVRLGLTETETAKLLGISRPRVWRWCKLAIKYPEAKQILERTGPLD
jgi:predicted DNA-binding protein (UPF0251 family)